MKLYAVYNKQNDLLTLNNIPPTPEMIADNNTVICSKTYEEEFGEFIAVMRNEAITILSRLEYYSLFGSQQMDFDKEAYYIKE